MQRPGLALVRLKGSRTLVGCGLNPAMLEEYALRDNRQEREKPLAR